MRKVTHLKDYTLRPQERELWKLAAALRLRRRKRARRELEQLLWSLRLLSR